MTNNASSFVKWEMSSTKEGSSSSIVEKSCVYMYGENWVMQKYVIEQQTAIRTAVIKKTFPDRLFLIFLINSISHPSNCFYVVNGAELFPQIFDVCVNNPFFSEKFIFPKSL